MLDIQTKQSKPVPWGFRRNKPAGGHRTLHITKPDYSTIQPKESTSRTTPNTGSEDKKRSPSMPKPETTQKRIKSLGNLF